jgi:rubrerythrin
MVGLCRPGAIEWAVPTGEWEDVAVLDWPVGAVGDDEMPQLKGSKTEENLWAALDRESQDNRRFEYFARRAAVEGHVAAARLFREVANGETAHAMGHLELLEVVSDPPIGADAGAEMRRSLQAAVALEEDGCARYPALAAIAREERLLEVAEWFDLIARAKQARVARLVRALESFEDSE